MNILHICKKPPFPEHDGEAIAIASFLRSWHSAGYKVTSVVLHTKKHPFEFEKIPEEFQTSITWIPIFVDTSISFKSLIQNLFSTTSLNINRFQPDNLISSTIDKLKSLNLSINLIQAEGIYVNRLAYELKKQIYPLAKYCFRSHNIEYKLWEQRANESSGLKKRFFNYQAHKIKQEELGRLNQADAHIDISNADLNHFQKRGLQIPAIAIATGINQESLSSYSVDYSKSNIQFLGSLDWTPNLEGLKWLSEHVMHSELKNKGIKISVAGKNPPKGLQSDLGDSFNLIGEVPNAEEYLSKSGIFIIPLKSGSGVKIKMLQALSLGLPIISTSYGVEGLSIQHNKEIILANTATEWKQALLELSNNSIKRTELGNAAIQYAKEHIDQSVIFNKWLKFIQSIKVSF